MRREHILTGVVLICCWVCRTAGGQTVGHQQNAAIGISGNESLVWVYYQSDSEGHTALNFALRLQGHKGFVGPAELQGLSGRVQLMTVNQLDLHVFYDEGTHRRYRFTPGTVSSPPRITAHSEVPLPQSHLPLAIVASDDMRLHAVVTRETGELILDRQNERIVEENDARLDENTGAEALKLVELSWGDSAFAVVSYTAGDWEIVSAIPAGFNAHRECRLVQFDEDVLCLFYRVPGQAELQQLEYAEEMWSPPAGVAGSAGHQLLGAAAFKDRVVLVTRSPGHTLQSFMSSLPEVNGWIGGRPIRLPGASDSATMQMVAASRFSQSVGLLVLGEEGAVSFGLWPIEGGTAIEVPQVIAALKADRRSDRSYMPGTLIPFAILSFLLIFVFWRRKDSITRELNLPAQFVVASLWRRLAGFVLDAAPISMLTFFVWYPVIRDFMDAYRALEVAEQQSPLMTTELLTGWIVCCGVYSVYCMICEALFTMTPGKLAVQCHVVSEDGHRCRLGQIFLRNILRPVELFPLFQLWPTFILMLFTRNRQRLGDLLARSIVVERVSPSRRRTPS